MADTVINIGRGQILLGNYLLDAYDVNITPHSSDFEYFESYEGIIAIKKQLDKHVELKFKTIFTEQNVSTYKYDPTQPNDPETVRKDFVELRQQFLDEVDGQVVVVASTMFKPFKGVVSARSYQIPGGETHAEFDIEVREVE